MNRQTLILVVVTAAIFFMAVSIAHHFARVVPQPNPINQPKAVLSKRELVGINSCSASACHGGVETGARLSETATWRALDPHARAYLTLLSEQSQRIAQQLWNGKAQAHEASLCLKCHVHPNYEQARPNFRRQDGVGCESCHGAAGEWLTPHYRADWKPSLGMLDTKTLYGRANGCATCHVGTPGANVDHDLIAAGHPSLRFEFATYFANLPPHWDVARDRQANTRENGLGFDFEAWVIGQWVSSAAASELLSYRADPANGQVWPEFAELDCRACHHDLQGELWRNSNGAQDKRRLGSLRFDDWYTAMLPGFKPYRDLDAPRHILQDRIALAKKARAHAMAQRERAKTVEVGEAQLRSLQTFAQKLGNRDGRLDGNLATQMYFALLAARPIFKDDALSERLRRDLTFAPDARSRKR